MREATRKLVVKIDAGDAVPEVRVHVYHTGERSIVRASHACALRCVRIGGGITMKPWLGLALG